MSWTKTIDAMPKENQIVITYGKQGMRLCKYCTVLTWRGYKPKFVNLLSSVGIWDDEVTHWIELPKPPQL